MGRFALPLFGGGSAVWTTCMLFFQVMLLLGYAYAHWLGSRKNFRTQTSIHLGLLLLSLVFLPISPRVFSQGTSTADPSLRILLLLLTTVGGPYLLLSATTPLLQRWFHLTLPATNISGSPWRLYALSNVASFLALFSYPLLIEPFLRLRTQTLLWSILYAAFAAACGYTAWKIGTITLPTAQTSEPTGEPNTREPTGERNTREPERQIYDRPPWQDILLWLGLAAFASLILLGTTSQITQEIAVIPFLWIAPLAVYLLSFILTFESDRWYRRGTFAVLAGVLAPLAYAAGQALPVWLQLLMYLAALFAVCMLCHGELALLRPQPAYLTMFYLIVAAGGALGGLFASLIAPRIFTQFNEYWIGLAGACICGFLAWLRTGALSEWTGANFSVRVPLMALVFGAATPIVVMTYDTPNSTPNNNQPTLLRTRNFYGILRVSEKNTVNGRVRELTHGRVQHGQQFVTNEPAKRDLTTTYYGPHSGAALAITALPHPRKIAVIGLGAGTLAAWGRSGDTYRFYEINPSVNQIAHQYFSFLKDTPASTEVVLGDARVQMEAERKSGRSHDVNLIAVDAFSGDAIPMHLLTTEAADLYRDRLAPGGILALHISNRSLDLEPIARGLARHLAWQARMVVVAPDLLDQNPNGESNSRWVLLTEKRETFAESKIRDTFSGWNTNHQPVITWTDDFASLWPILKLR